MSVKTIFMTLLAAVVTPVIVCCLVEFYNVSMASAELTRIVRTAAYKSAELFTQETYKESDATGSGGGKAGATKLGDIYNRDGGKYLSGNIYGTDNKREIWENLYGQMDSPFAEWLKAFKTGSHITYVGAKPNVGAGEYPWVALQSLAWACDGTYEPILQNGMPEWDASGNLWTDYSKAMQADTYFQNMYTPINLGIPYLDKDTTQKIFRWQLTQLLSNCDEDLIQEETDPDGNGTGRYFVNYRGFACYCDTAKIKSLDYEIYNLNDSSTHSKFMDATHMKATQLATGNAHAEESVVCTVGITYTLDVEYIGITPIRRLFNWIWDQNTEVDGYWGPNGSWAGQDRGIYLTYNDSATTLTAGGLRGEAASTFSGGSSVNALPVSDKLIYTLVR